MRREPTLTVNGALRILGRYDADTVGKLDRILGGAIIVAGVGSGLAAVGGAALAPLAILAPIWGWVDQKNEALGLVRSIVNRLPSRITPTAGLERRNLIAAAHTVIVVASFFEIFEEEIGRRLSKDLEISDAEKARIAAREYGGLEDSWSWLYANEVPAPSPANGFEENLGNVEKWMLELSARLESFLDGLASWRAARDQGRLSPLSVPHLARERYRSHYIKLATDVPEFAMWSFLGEHAATRAAIYDANRQVNEALTTHSRALSRIQHLLDTASNVRPEPPSGGLRDVIKRANRSMLSQSIVAGDIVRHDTELAFPSLEQQFIAPRYRLARYDTESAPADERWWLDKEVRRDLEEFLSAYLTTSHSTRLPLLVLGHPGAGKSVLTKVIAAQLPSAEYVVVRVPLRSVGANAPIIDQIQQALDSATNRRVEWHRLSDESQDALRVVILDGLDELLQASKLDRRGYLQEIAAFQQIEGDQQRPVAVIVTSRTVVADRADIPRGTPLIKIDEFDEAQIRAWLNAWATANSTPVAAGNMRLLAVDEALSQFELARQPLLLLMLAVYAADPQSTRLAAGLSTSALYEEILGAFARREVAKSSQHSIGSQQFGVAVKEQLFRLSIAALAMFNRGAQHVREVDLQSDLDALSGERQQDDLATDRGRRLLGEFFFVHSAEAVLLGAGEASVETAERRHLNETDRSYEFLHSTFGEFLTARIALDALRDAADAAFGGSRGGRDPDDDFLYAILSHQPLPIRRSSVTFIREMHDVLPSWEQENIQNTLRALISSYRRRYRSNKYARYQPTPVDAVGRLAAYSANLITLAVQLTHQSGIRLPDYFSESNVPAQLEWRSTVSLWIAGLGAESFRETLALLSYDPRNDLLRPFEGGKEDRISDDAVQYFRALGNEEQVRRQRFGMALIDQQTFDDDDSRWLDVVLSIVLVGLAHGDVPTGSISLPPEHTSLPDTERAKLAIELLLRTRAATISEDHIIGLVVGLLALSSRPDTDALLTALFFHPNLLVAIERLADKSLYGLRHRELMFVLAATERDVSPDMRYQWLARRARLVGDTQLLAAEEWGLDAFRRVFITLTQGARSGKSIL